MGSSGKSQYDIFICYRRESGAETAKHLRDILAEEGYRVFFDTDSLRSGNFNTALLDVIASCNDFIIVLFPEALDRCANSGDWVRRELACALENGKNVIPIRGRGFHFPDDLPADIEAVRWKNGIDVNIEYFDAMIERLLGFLNSKPKSRRKPAATAAALATLSAAAAMLCLFVFGGSSFGNGSAGSHEEVAPVEETLGADDIGESLDGTDEDAQGEEGSAQSLSNEYYILPESNVRLYTKDELETLGDWELWVARNELYARHGRKFSSRELQDYFDGQPWYVGLYEPREYDQKGRPKVYNTCEARNRALIEQIESERNSRYAG